MEALISGLCQALSSSKLDGSALSTEIPREWVLRKLRVWWVELFEWSNMPSRGEADMGCEGVAVTKERDRLARFVGLARGKEEGPA